eukprot:gene6601-biopygen5938
MASFRAGDGGGRGRCWGNRKVARAWRGHGAGMARPCRAGRPGRARPAEPAHTVGGPAPGPTTGRSRK